MQFVDKFFSRFSHPISETGLHPGTVLLTLVMAGTLSVLVAIVYMISHRQRGYKQTFVQSLVLLSTIVAAVMMVIGNNLAGAFGLVGAVSIIRFRTKVGNPRDTAYIFLAISVGMACGLQQYMVAVIATFFLGGMLLLFWRFDFGSSGGRKKPAKTDG